MKLRFISALLALCLCTFTATSLLSCTDKEEENTGSTGTEEITDVPPMEVADADDLSYMIFENGKECMVIGLTATEGAKAIRIPEKFNGAEVIAISSNAFSSMDMLESVFIPDSVKYIGENAFDGCIKLSNITIPKDLRYLGSSAFEGCDELKLKEYGNALYLGSEDSPYTVLMSAVDQKIESCMLHPDTKVIYELAFADCTEMESIIIPDGINYIGIDAFYDCLDLQLTRHDSIDYIGNEDNPYLVCVKATAKRNTEDYTLHEDTKIIISGAFLDCKELRSVSLPNKLTAIAPFAFDECPKLTAVNLDRISEWKIIDTENLENSIAIENSSPDFFTMLIDTHRYCAWLRQ